MNESNGRKTLISVKVSTLLLILLVIIVLIVIGIVIANQTKKNNDEINNTKVTNTPSEEPTENNIVRDNWEDVQTENDSSYNRDSSVSSRSSAPREKIQVVLSDKENVEIIHEKEPEPEPEVVTTPIEEVTISKDMDLTVRTGLSRDDFIKLMSGVEQDTSNFFEENAGLIYDLCEKYGLNEIFFCGLISAESGWTIASNHRSTHNYISLMSGSGLIRFDSVESGLEKAAETLHNNYLYPGGKFYYGPTLAGMKTRFCPASSTWVNLVYQRMSQILN